jgi:hypothetical protein
VYYRCNETVAGSDAKYALYNIVEGAQDVCGAGPHATALSVSAVASARLVCSATARGWRVSSFETWK